MPGHDTTFDVVNIHLVHGMQVVPHLFHPQGTGNPAAPWITIAPRSDSSAVGLDPAVDQRCYCYVFEVPANDHPMGTFWYHIHRHGSTTMQSWQGMAGLVQVGNASTPGSPEHDLGSHNVTRHEPMVLWEWAIEPNNTVAGATKPTLFEGSFLNPAKITLLNNNEFQPTYNMTVNETVHMPLICAQTSTGNFTETRLAKESRE